MLALKVEEGAVSPGVRAAPGTWKRPGRYPQSLQKGARPCDTWISAREGDRCRLPAHGTIRWCICVV